MVVSQKEFTKRAAIWLAYQYELQHKKKNQHIVIFKSGQVYDIGTCHTNLDRGIEVKGSCESNPPAFRIYSSILRSDPWLNGQKPLNSKKYYVYLIYNIKINCRPRLVILDSKFIRKYGKRGEDGTYHVLGISDGINKHNIKIYEGPTLTKARKRTINNFYNRYKQHCKPSESGWQVK